MSRRGGAALSRERGELWASAGLTASLVEPPTAASLRRVAPWIVATQGERLDLPPLGTIADFGALLFGATLDVKTRPRAPFDDARLASALRRYEDGVLARLAADPRLTSAGFAALRLPPRKHAQAVGVLVTGVLGHLGFGEGVEVAPGLVRTLTSRSPVETIARGRTALREDAALRTELAKAYEALVHGALRSRALLSESDVFALENLEVLGSASQRMAISEVVDAEQALTEGLARTLPRRRRVTGAAPTALEDESQYPVGGFSSVSTSGSIENLVTSELIYMDPPGERSGEVDLFDMRYVEGELLYYTRDEAIFVRKRRLVSLQLPAELARARVKDRSLPWQRIVLVLAVVLAIVKKLTSMLGEEALSLRVVFIEPPGAAGALTEERGLAELLLAEWRDKGTLEILSATDAEEDAALELASRRALTQVVRIGSPRDGKTRSHVERHDFGVAHPDLSAWRDAVKDVLGALL